MSDDLYEVIYFDQHLILKKSLYEQVPHSGLNVAFSSKEGVILRPHIYFRPINTTDTFNEYKFSELIFECYEGMANVVSQLVEENDEEVHVITRYFMRHDDENGRLLGDKFIYKTEYYTFEYQIENSLVPIKSACTPLNPLGLSCEGTLECWVAEITLDKYFSLLR
ncbi:hypothetical protein [Shewanella sp.]|uniref:hypothetical protein n=1 Tax=Shewanella TaxID=22 RepID=UPI000EBFD06F|nr:hypothetical protein [Shewanella sp.]HCD14300.1 hypothetical protein [Shewanella sp.]